MSLIKAGNALTKRLSRLLAEFDGEPLQAVAYAMSCELVNMAMARGLTKADLIGSVEAMWDACAAPNADVYMPTRQPKGEAS